MAARSAVSGIGDRRPAAGVVGPLQRQRQAADDWYICFPRCPGAFCLHALAALSLTMLALLGLASIFVLNVANALVQSLVPEVLRGEVMSIYSLVFFGAMPIGSLLIGWLAQASSEQIAVLLNAGAGAGDCSASVDICATAAGAAISDG